MPTTEVYFIRHGIAEARHSGVSEAARSLTAKGITRTQRVAQRLADLGLQFDALLSSPLVRAQQTAEILLAAGLASHIEDCPALSLDGELSDWLDWLANWQHLEQSSDCPAIAIVGHEPNLSGWAQTLVTGKESDQWTLKKAGIIGLQLPAASEAIGRSQLFWLSPPRFLI